MTYHVVECGNETSEAIYFIHGLAENWKVWKEIMLPFCGSFRPIALDIECHGQSQWPNVHQEVSKTNSREFMGEMQLSLLNAMGVDRFNLVVTDVGFWSSLSMLNEKNLRGENRVLRYGKFQSTVGVEDPGRIPQGKLHINFPGIMETLVNSNPYAILRVICGKPLIQLPSVVSNSRTGPKGISDDIFESILLPGISRSGG